MATPHKAKKSTEEANAPVKTVKHRKPRRLEPLYGLTDQHTLFALSGWLHQTGIDFGFFFGMWLLARPGLKLDFCHLESCGEESMRKIWGKMMRGFCISSIHGRLMHESWNPIHENWKYLHDTEKPALYVKTVGHATVWMYTDMWEITERRQR